MVTGGKFHRVFGWRGCVKYYSNQWNILRKEYLLKVR